MKHLHEAIISHLIRDSLTIYIKMWPTGPGISKAIQKVIARCVMCPKNNPKTDPHQKVWKQYQGPRPCEDWQIEFTQMSRAQGWKYLLVFIDAFLGLVEAYPTRMGKSSR